VLYVPDACALLNLHHGGVLERALVLPECSFALGKAVYGEAKTLTEELDRLLGLGMVTLLDDAQIPAAEFLRIKEEYDLGDGETECLAAAIHLECRLVFDDAAARKVGIELLGQERITGTIGLLRMCVAAGSLIAVDAYAAYRLMRAVGAFLPEMPIEEMFP